MGGVRLHQNDETNYTKSKEKVMNINIDTKGEDNDEDACN